MCFIDYFLIVLHLHQMSLINHYLFLVFGSYGYLWDPLRSIFIWGIPAPDNEVIYLREYLDIAPIVHHNNIVIVVTIVLVNRCLLVVTTPTSS